MENKDPKTGTFLAGNKAARPGSRKGVRNRLHADFVVALQEHFEVVGKSAIEIAYRESPLGYLKLIASVLPKELIVEDGRVEAMSDEELESHLETIRQLRLGSGRGILIEGTATAPEPKKVKK
jgi:hypothetical protein